MGAQLRVVLDPGAPRIDQAEAGRALVEALVLTAPVGCTVEAILPAEAAVPLEGVVHVRTLPRGGAALARAWRWGRRMGVKGGLLHATTLAAPLVRHDRAHDHDQTVVTVWDLRAWDAEPALPKAEVAWQRAMLARAVRHADAVVVPAHAMAARLAEIAPLGERIRVIAGAPARGLQVPADAAERLLARGATGRYAVLSGGEESLPAGRAAAEAAGLCPVVLDGGSPAERAAVLAGARAFLATDRAAAWPWRVVEAMSMGVPVIAASSETHRDVMADGGVLAEPRDFAEALEAAVGPEGERMRVLARDRARAFSWASAAERVWALHADL